MAERRMTEDQMRADVRLWVDRDYGGSLRAAARQWKVSAAYLCDYLGGRRMLGPALQRIAGVRREVRVVYRPATPSENREVPRG